MSNRITEKIYELSFHLVPSLQQSEVDAMFRRIEKLLNKKGSVLYTDAPTLVPLAYDIQHTIRTIDGLYHRFSEAYFCSMKCRLTTTDIKEAQHELEDIESVLRLLIIETVEADTRYIEPAEETEAEAEEAETEEDEKEENVETSATREVEKITKNI